MWLTLDVVSDDINWYEVRLMFMMILIWNDVVIDDYVNMSWCYYWLFMLIWDDVVVVDNVIEMRWCWCWEWYWDEMLMMLKIHCDDVVYVHGGALTLLDVLGGENKVVKKF